MIEASELPGTKVLVGITRKHVSGEITQEQFAGSAQIEERDDYCLVNIDCTDGEVRSYPFDARALARAAPGEYRLRSTGEVVKNPDFLMTWTVTEGQAEE